METPALQYCIGPAAFGGLHWVDCKDRAEEFISRAMALHGTSREGVLELIASGPKAARYDTEWYAYLRDKAKGEAADARVKARAEANRQAMQKTRCKACGEYLPASRFTTLPASAQTCDDCA